MNQAESLLVHISVGSPVSLAVVGGPAKDCAVGHCGDGLGGASQSQESVTRIVVEGALPSSYRLAFRFASAMTTNAIPMGIALKSINACFI